MLIAIDGDDGDALCGSLERLGHVVVRPFVHDGLSSECDRAFRVCLLLSWYLVTARAHASGKGVVFVAGSPTTVDVVDAGLGPGARSPFLGTYHRLLGLLRSEFRPSVYVLVPCAARDRAVLRGVPHCRAQAINSRYWSMYRGLLAAGQRVMIL
jgi:hypothetical protein